MWLQASLILGWGRAFKNIENKIRTMIQTYLIIAALLVVAELAYFKIADKFNIIDKPNERSSHSTIVLR